MRLLSPCRRILVTSLALCALVAAGLLPQPVAGLTPGQRAVLLTKKASTPAWLPLAGGVAPTLFADFTTEGTTNHYWFNNQQYASFAAWNTAIGGVFTRSSTATYLQSGVVQTQSSGLPRFPTDINGNPTGIRLTGAGTNIELRSQTFANAAWSTDHGSATDNNLTAPDGTGTGSTFTEDTASGTHDIFQGAFSSTNGTTYAASVFLKAGTRRYVELALATAGQANGFYVIIDTTNFTMSGHGALGDGTDTSRSVTALASGWYLVTISGVVTAASAGTTYFVLGGSTDGTTPHQTYTGTSSTWNMWGAQATQTAFPLDYIPTTTGTVTQAADSYVVGPNGGVPFTRFNAGGPGTLFVVESQDYVGVNAAYRGIAGFQNSGDTDSVAWLHQNGVGGNGGRYRVQIYASNSPLLDTTSSSAFPIPLNGTTHKMGAAWAPTDYSAVVDAGTPIISSTAGVLPSLDRLKIGFPDNATAAEGGQIKQIAYWPSRISNANLQSLTQ